MRETLLSHAAKIRVRIRTTISFSKWGFFMVTSAVTGRHSLRRRGSTGNPQSSEVRCGDAIAPPLSGPTIVTFTFTLERSFVFEEFRVNAARAVIFEFGDDGGHAAEFDLFDDAFAELLVAYD